MEPPQARGRLVCRHGYACILGDKLLMPEESAGGSVVRSRASTRSTTQQAAILAVTATAAIVPM